MTHSTLTWFSGVIKPSQSEDQILIAMPTLNGDKIEVIPDLFRYNKKQDVFTSRAIPGHVDRKDVRYWAYVPLYLEDHEGKG
jgi:hypothetical protein